ncbi:acyl-CoA desaturase [bacterium]|nr:acyl-CoA desaturase [bacterium]
MTHPDQKSAPVSDRPASGLASASGTRGKWLYAGVALSSIVVPTLGSIYALFLLLTDGISALDLAMLVFFYVFTVLGIELGYHRYMTHRSLKMKPFLKKLMIIAGAMNADGPPLWWAAIHRRHHLHSDNPGDPHSPNTPHRGFAGWWHAHIAWMLKPEHTAAETEAYAKDLLRDKDILRIDRMFLFWILVGLLVPAVIGGLGTGTLHGAWTGFIWGGLVRMCLAQHALWWGIVTLCHTIGTRPFTTTDLSRNNVLVAILFLGDGWHNNHHAFPASAKVGLRWWEFDPTWWVIAPLKSLGVIWDVNVPTERQIEAQYRRPRRSSTDAVPS